MLIIPAIDIRGGRVVRLKEGDYGRETVYHDDPAATARRWREDGAEYIHVVDLDGARDGAPVNLDIAAEIIREAGVPVEIGGGIRSMNTVDRYAELGADLIILGTVACESPDFLAEAMERHGEKIAVSLDCREDTAAVRGWTESSGKKIPDLVGQFERAGVKNLIFTDISRDGLLSGVDVERVRGIVSLTSMGVTVAGGVGSLDDIVKLGSLGIRGVIVGKAIYSGNIDFKEAVKCLKK